MLNMKIRIHYFSKTELTLWCCSVLSIILSFYFFGQNSYLTLLASLIGVTSLILNAKGNPWGQCLMIIFSLLYGIISFTFAYYGEMATYLGMTMPMSIFALISWLKHPYSGNKTEVQVNSNLSTKEIIQLGIATTIITIIFYYLLKFFHTANIIPSTISVTTSFLAVYLTQKRTPYFALAYAANDCILILLWILASIEDAHYLSVVVCFIAFLFNDIYGFFNWRKMEKRQRSIQQPVSN